MAFIHVEIPEWLNNDLRTAIGDGRTNVSSYIRWTLFDRLKETTGVSGEDPNNFPTCEDGTSKRRPVVPYDKIKKLYLEILPMGRVFKDWSPARRSHVRARWSGPYLNSLEDWERYFRKVSKSAFLTGKVENRERPAFRVSLPWLAKQENFLKVWENNYD